MEFSICLFHERRIRLKVAFIRIGTFLTFQRFNASVTSANMTVTSNENERFTFWTSTECFHSITMLRCASDGVYEKQYKITISSRCYLMEIHFNASSGSNHIECSYAHSNHSSHTLTSCKRQETILNKQDYSPNDNNPLFSMLNLIVFGIDTKLVVALNVFFFFGFSKSAYRDVELWRKEQTLFKIWKWFCFFIFLILITL